MRNKRPSIKESAIQIEGRELPGERREIERDRTLLEKWFFNRGDTTITTPEAGKGRDSWARERESLRDRQYHSMF